MIERIAAHLKAEWAEALRMARSPALEAQQRSVDEGALGERAAEGAAARQFLESRYVTDFMAKAEARLTQEMIALDPKEDEGRYRMAVAIQSQRQLMKYLLAMTRDGAMAERELIRLRDPKKRAFF